MKTSCRDIKTLHPVLQRGAVEFLKRCEANGLKVLITETIRDEEYQGILFAKRPKVTNLSGKKGEQSPHQFGIAFDICKNVKGQEYSDNAFFKACGAIWVEMGGTWGGNWTSFVDKPHFEFTDGKGYATFRGGYNFPSGQKMKWETINTDVEDARILIKKCDIKGVQYDKAYWARVTNGEIKADPQYIKTLVERLAKA